MGLMAMPFRVDLYRIGSSLSITEVVTMTRGIATYMAMTTACFAMMQAVPCSLGVAQAAEDSAPAAITHQQDSSKRSWPPLIQASRKCRLEEVQALLASGVDPNEFDSTRRTPLHHAVRLARLGGRFLPRGKPLKLVELLLAAGADPKRTDRTGATVLHYAARQPGPEAAEVIQLLLASGADIRAKDKYGNTPLHDAAMMRSPEAARVLLANGAAANARGAGDVTPLIHAALITIVWGFDPDYDRTSPNLLEIVKVLLAAGADVNARTEKGMTALNYALKTGKTGIVDLLKAHGAKE